MEPFYSNSLKLNVARIGILGLFIINVFQINYLFKYDSEDTCKNPNIKDFIPIFKGLTIMHIILLGRMGLNLLLNNYREINWNFLCNHSEHRFNFCLSFKVIHTFQAIIGLIHIISLSLIYKNKPYCNNDEQGNPIDDTRLIEFITYSYIPYTVFSLYVYYYTIKYISLYTVLMIFPYRYSESIFKIFGMEETSNNQVRNLEEVIIQQPRPIYLVPKINIIANDYILPELPNKVFTGNIIECSVCYEPDCNILECGHLICNTCQTTINRKNNNNLCPLCRTSMNIVCNYNTYNKDRDRMATTIIHDILDKL